MPPVAPTFRGPDIAGLMNGPSPRFAWLKREPITPSIVLTNVRPMRPTSIGVVDMSLKTTFAKILSSAGPTLRRFWVPVLLTVAITTIMISLLPDAYNDRWDQDLFRLAIALVPGVFGALCAILFWERRSIQGGQGSSELTANLVGLGVSAIISGLAYLGLGEFNHVTIGRHAALTVFLFLGFFVVPHYRNEGSLEMYTVRLFSHGVVSALFSAVMFLGLTAITFTISSLFSLNLSERIYMRIWMVMTGVLAPFLFMAGIPRGTVPNEPDDYPKVLRNLVLFVLTPLLTAYTAILYVYFAKILITRQWPVGLVAHLVLWYSIFSTALLLFVWPLSSNNGWADGFSKYFIKAVIPLLLMMFAAIGIRINYYGITENRYYVLVLGLWVLGMMAYLNLKKPRRSIVLPTTLAIVVALSVVGPWSSFAVSKYSQNRRLEGLLNKYGMLLDGAVVPSKAEVPVEDQREMAEVLFYFNRNHDLSEVRHLPAGFTMEDFPEVFGFNYLDVPGLPSQYFGYQGSGGALDVSGYRYLFQFSGVPTGDTPVTSFEQGNIAASYDRDTQRVTVTLDGAPEWEGSFIQHIRKFLPAEGLDKKSFSQEEMTFVGEGGNLKAEIVITSLSGSVNGTTGEPEIYHVEFYLLVGDRT